MTQIFKKLLAIALPLPLLASCGSDDGYDAAVNTFQQKTGALRGAAFGLARNELALTLDDGPGPHTKGLARYLEYKKIPATFFVNFKNGVNGIDSPMGRDTMKTLCQSEYLDVGNHSDFHNTSSRAWSEIERTHNFLLSHCAKSWMFFRSPGGNWKPTDADVLNNTTDQNGLSLRTAYIGPVYWDYGGSAPQADWHPECRNNPNWCRTVYKEEIVAGGGAGIVLAHDIHASTIEMLLGSDWRKLIENPAAPHAAGGLLHIMEQSGYRWVSLTQNKNIIVSLLGRPISLVGWSAN
jgi:peptidoglycan/xylan/chitin deacetylase (PgdA/CDA1 family)